ncbi:LAGLIDADG family homing endonuclease [Staphylococcus pseudintermedius]|uniref:LAGLIDADG family homing endonuclease n=1 Tax=Staphylococcus pseudintermedius TaxID=283734 RepID=UPI001BDF5324|nr:LAGLIDADG family homing endonuclease [Staphylococcus pseudintermedius]
MSEILINKNILEKVVHLFNKRENFYNVVRMNGRPTGKILWTNEQKEHIFNLHYEHKVAIPYIALKFKVNHETIRALFKKSGKEIFNYTTYKRIYKVNHNYFDKIDSEDKAYWLGMLYADGTMIEKQNTVKLSLQGLDVITIDMFRKALNSDYPFEYYINNKAGSYGTDESQMCALKVRSEQLFNSLLKLGCVPRKTENLTFPSDEIVPRRYLKDFIRGFTDGDGSINYCKPNNKRHYTIEWGGTESMLKGILEYVLSIGISTNAKVRKNKNHRFMHKLQFSGNELAPKIINHLYDGANSFMFRKKNTVNEMNDYLKDFNIKKTLEKELKELNKQIEKYYKTKNKIKQEEII